MKILNKVFSFFHKKNNVIKGQENSIFPVRLFNKQKSAKFNFSEPVTLASEEFKKLNSKIYENHRQILNNQWINPIQGINFGIGTANLSTYLRQAVNYSECSILAQDPLMNNIFDILTTTPFSKGGKLSFSTNKDIGNLEYIADKKYNILSTLEKAVKYSFIFGGCLIYMDFGDIEYLEQPLEEQNFKNFLGFRVIEPINCSVAEVNIVNPLFDDYMEPERWYVSGVGVVHKSRFIKFEWNVPPLSIKPLCMYFGMPMTQLLKQDVANVNLVSQGLANLVNDVRKIFLKTDALSFATGSSDNILYRIETMEEFGNNHRIFPIKQDEDVIQLNTSLSNYRDIVETFVNSISSKTGIPNNKITGASTGGLNANTSQIESDKNFIDKIETIRNGLIKQRLLKMYQVAINSINNSNYYVDDLLYEFNSLNNPTELEKTDNISKNVDVAIKLKELGLNDSMCLNWLIENKILNIGLTNGKK